MICRLPLLGLGSLLSRLLVRVNEEFLAISRMDLRSEVSAESMRGSYVDLAGR